MCECNASLLDLTNKKLGVAPIGLNVQIHFASAPGQGRLFPKLQGFPGDEEHDSIVHQKFRNNL